MTNLLHDELALRAAATFDEAAVLDAVHRNVSARRVRRRRLTVGAAGLVVILVVVGTVAVAQRSPQTATAPLPTAPTPGIEVRATLIGAADPAAGMASADAVKARLADLPGVSVELNPSGGVVVTGPATDRERILAALTTPGQLSVRPVLANSSDVPAPKTPSTLPAQPSGIDTTKEWQDSALAAAKKNSLPCVEQVASAIADLPLISCDDGVVSVLAPTIITGPIKAEAVLDQAGAGWVIDISFDAADLAVWSSYTAGHVGGQTAFVIDNQTVSAPTIAGAITTSTTQISGSFPEDEAKILAVEINHALPTAFTVTDISPTR